MVRIEGLTPKATLFFSFFSFFYGIPACFGGYRGYLKVGT